MKIGKVYITAWKEPKEEYGVCACCGKPLTKAQYENRYGLFFSAHSSDWATRGAEIRMCKPCMRKYKGEIDKLLNESRMLEMKIRGVKK